MIKGWSCKEDIAILNVYAPNKRATKYRKQKLIEMKKETDKSTVQLQSSTVLSEQGYGRTK